MSTSKKRGDEENNLDKRGGGDGNCKSKYAGFKVEKKESRKTNTYNGSDEGNNKGDEGVLQGIKDTNYKVGKRTSNNGDGENSNKFSSGYGCFPGEGASSVGQANQGNAKNKYDGGGGKRKKENFK